MRFTALALAALFELVAAIPAELEPRATTCNHDNLYRSFVVPTNSICASAFCSSFIATPFPAVTAGTTTTTTTLTRSIFTTSTPPPAKAKRQAATSCTTSFPVDFDFYGSSRVSSACSCIVTAPSSYSVAGTTTIPAATQTVTSKTTETDVYLPSGYPVCGIRGYASFTNHLGGFGTGATPAYCHEFCLDNSAPPYEGCGTFSYDSVDGTCQTYKGPATSNGFHVDPNSPNIFYDNSCSVPS